MTVHDIDSTRQSVDLASSSNVDDQQASRGSFVQRVLEDDGANQERQPLFQSYESYRPMGNQELDSIGDLYAFLLAGLEECERVLRVEEGNMQNFFYLQETQAFNKTAASIQERDARGRLTSSFQDMSLTSFPSRSTTTPVPFIPPTITLEPMSLPKSHGSGDNHRVPFWTYSSEVGHDCNKVGHNTQTDRQTERNIGLELIQTDRQTEFSVRVGSVAVADVAVATMTWHHENKEEEDDRIKIEGKSLLHDFKVRKDSRQSQVLLFAQETEVMVRRVLMGLL